MPLLRVKDARTKHSRTCAINDSAHGTWLYDRDVHSNVLTLHDFVAPGCTCGADNWNVFWKYLGWAVALGIALGVIL